MWGGIISDKCLILFTEDQQFYIDGSCIFCFIYILWYFSHRSFKDVCFGEMEGNQVTQIKPQWIYPAGKLFNRFKWHRNILFIMLLKKTNLCKHNTAIKRHILATWLKGDSRRAKFHTSSQISHIVEFAAEVYHQKLKNKNTEKITYTHIYNYYLWSWNFAYIVG